jgi:hypothetical protein
MILAYDLPPKAEAIRASIPREVRNSVSRITGGPQNRSQKRKRIIPLWKITWGQILLEVGLSRYRIQRLLSIGETVMRDIAEDRVTLDGRPPMELEPYERYIAPKRCERGHLISIWPCRQCRAQDYKAFQSQLAEATQ